MSEFDPLVERVDALLKRHQQPPSPPRPPATAAPAALAGQPEPEPEAPVQGAADLDDDIPVLTEVVDDFRAPEPSAELEPIGGLPPDEKTLSAQIEGAVLEKVLAEIDRSLDMRLNRSIGDLLDQTLDGLRAELSASVRQSVREAVEAAMAKERAGPTRES